MTNPGDVLLNLSFDGGVNAIAFSPDSGRIAWGGDATTVSIRAVGTGPRLEISGLKGFVASVAFSPDGALLAIADLDEVLVYDAVSGALKWGGPIEAQRSINFVAFTPDGASVIAITDDLVAVLDSASGQPRTFPVEATVADVDVSNDGAMLVVAVDKRHGANHVNEGAAVVFDLAGGTEVTRLTPDNAVHAVGFVMDAAAGAPAVLFGAADGTTRLFKSDTGAEIWRLPSQPDQPPVQSSHLAVDPSGKLAIVGDADGNATVLDLRRDGQAKFQAQHVGAVNAVAFAPNGLLAASCGIDNVLQVQVPANQAFLYNRSIDEVRTMIFSPDSRWLALGHLGSLVVYDNGSP
ncbi:MAG TPA: WD40 repeat domain-containing protein [Mycobacterium sp.]